MQLDRPVVAGGAQQRDHALALAQRVDAHQMRRARGTAAASPAACRSRSASGGWRNTGRPKVASVMKTSHGTGSNGGQVGSAGACSRRRRRRAAPACSSTTCAQPRMWPAGTKRHRDVADAVTRLAVSAAARSRPLSGIRRSGAHDRQRLAGVASTRAPWPGRAWSPWPWVITARGDRPRRGREEVARLAHRGPRGGGCAARRTRAGGSRCRGSSRC